MYTFWTGEILVEGVLVPRDLFDVSLAQSATNTYKRTTNAKVVHTSQRQRQLACSRNLRSEVLFHNF